MYLKLKRLVDRISQDEIFIYSAQSSFYMITASIPFMMLFLALLKFLFPLTEQETLALLKPLIPPNFSEVSEVLIGEIYGKSLALMSFGGIAAFWSASRGVLAVQRGIRKVYKSCYEKNFLKDIAVSVFYTVLLLIALLAILLFMVFGDVLYGIFKNILPQTPDFKGKGILLIALWVFFTFMYWILVGKGTRIKDHVVGGIFTALGWFLASFIFSVYVENFANYSYVYGSLSVIVLMMLWIYILMIILLLGAEVNVFIKERILKR